jgi:hypothetical protein
MSGASLYGFDRQFAQHASCVSLNAFPVNSTTKLCAFQIPAGFGSVRIVSVEWVSDVVLSDADGTCLVTVSARDVSEAAADAVVASTNIEAGTANVPAAFTLTAETAENELTLDEGDWVFVTFVNNSAAIDTNGMVAVTIFWHSIPTETAGSDIKHVTFYKP